MHRGNGFGFGPWVIPIILITLMVLALYMIFKNNKENKQSPKNQDPPKSTKALEILNERYAKGEIDDEEYQQIKNNLNK